eukprot:745871-Hanusia_phi.AAC.1
MSPTDIPGPGRTVPDRPGSGESAASVTPGAGARTESAKARCSPAFGLRLTASEHMNRERVGAGMRSNAASEHGE